MKKVYYINHKFIQNFCYINNFKVVKKFARLNKKNIDEDIFVKATVNTEEETNNNNEEVIVV